MNQVVSHSHVLQTVNPVQFLTLKWARNLAADNYGLTWPQGSSLPITVGWGLSYVLEQQNFDYLIEIIYISVDVLISHKIKYLIF